MEMIFRRWTQWPGEFTRNRKRSQFRAAYSATLELLEDELRALQARHIVLQADCADSEIRLDGQLRSGAKLNSPAIILSFESKVGALSYPCDRYDSWKDNLRAIALALQALRAVDRYGVTKRAEQYKGWTALPSPEAPHDTYWARSIIQRFSGASEVSWKEPYQTNAARYAKRKTHPDAGGNAEDFKAVMEACQILGL